MRFKAAIIIVILVLTQVFLDSCCKINTVFDIDGFGLVNLDNSGGTPTEVGDTAKINKNAYGIRIYLKTKTLASQDLFKNVQFVGKTYAACTQDFTLKNKIKSIKITNVFWFDDNTPANSDITNYFNGLADEYGPYISVDDKIKELNSSLNKLPEYFDIYLMKAPEQLFVSSFKVRIELYDDSYAEIATDYVTLF